MFTDHNYETVKTDSASLSPTLRALQIKFTYLKFTLVSYKETKPRLQYHTRIS